MKLSGVYKTEEQLCTNKEPVVGGGGGGGHLCAIQNPTTEAQFTPVEVHHLMVPFRLQSICCTMYNKF